MLTSRTGRWSLGTALLCVLLLAASWFLLISPRRADADDLRQQAVSVNSQVGVLQQQLAQLKAQFGELDKQKADLKAIKEQLPPDADVPTLVRNLQDFAGTAGVSLDSVTPGTPAVLDADGTADPNARAGAGSLVTVPLAIGVTGQYFEDSLYLKYLQTQMKRSMLITGLATTPATDASASTATPAPGASATPTPAATAPVSPVSPDLSMTINSSVFVLLDGTSSLEKITEEARTAALGAQASAATTAVGGTTTTR